MKSFGLRVYVPVNNVSVMLEGFPGFEQELSNKDSVLLNDIIQRPL